MMKNLINNLLSCCYKTKFSTTDPQYLLGNALDQCWEGEAEEDC